jgi:alpha-ketoglutarate-dependent taurine dioxygenase
MTNDLQKTLIQRMGELVGKPKESTLHIHPVLNPQRAMGGDDLHISTINSRQRIMVNGKATPCDLGNARQALEAWHSDIQSEQVPSDYTCLRLTELPSVGGGMFTYNTVDRMRFTDSIVSDTLWASGYEVYDRISEPMRKFLENHTANYTAPCKSGDVAPSNSPNANTILRSLRENHQKCKHQSVLRRSWSP